MIMTKHDSLNIKPVGGSNDGIVISLVIKAQSLASKIVMV